MTRILFAIIVVTTLTIGACTPEPPADTPASPAAAAPPDPFLGYYETVKRFGEVTNDANGRQIFESAKATYCPRGRQALEQVKQASHLRGADRPEWQRRADKAALEAGATWEFACGQGHDVALYTPLPLPAEARTSVKTTPKASAPRPKSKYTCEPLANPRFDPSEPNIIINKDCPELNARKSRAQLEYKRQREREAANTGRDANGETKLDYCRRTGQPITSCQAG